MQLLLNKTKNIDYNKLKKFMLKISTYELSKLSEDCYYPSTKRNYFELLNICKLTSKDMIEYVKRFYQGTPAKNWRLQKDPYTNLLIFIMHLFLLRKDLIGYQASMIYFIVRYYSNLMHKQIKWCNKDTFRYTLEHLTKVHLFTREKTIPNSLYFLAKEMEKNHTKNIKAGDVNGIISFISKSRHRISQSIKSFAEGYYRFSKEGLSIKTQKEEPDNKENIHQYQVLVKGERTIDNIVKKITVYKIVDKKALNEAKKLTRIKMGVATEIANKLKDTEYSDIIKTILKLFIKDLKDIKYLCGKDYYNYVKKLMAVKRSSLNIYYKQQINILLLKIIEEINYLKIYKSFTSQTQFLLNSYLSYYLTLSLRNEIC